MKKILIVLIALLNGLILMAQESIAPSCISGTNLVLNPSFETGTSVGSPLTTNVPNWASLFSGSATADYLNNTFGMTGSKCVAMWTRLGNTAGTQNYREGIQGTLSQPVKANSGSYCIRLQVARHPNSLNNGPVRIVIYGIRLGAFNTHINTPLSTSNMILLYPSITKVPIATFDVTSISATPTYLQTIFNSSVMTSGTFFNRIIITRSDEMSSNADAARYLLLDDIGIRKL